MLSPWCTAKPVAQLFVQWAVELDMLEPLFVMLRGPACAERCSTKRAEAANGGCRSGHADGAVWHGGVRFDHLIYEVFQQIDSTAGDQKIVVYKEKPRWAHGLSNDHHNMTISRLMTIGPRRHQRWQRTIYP